MEKGRLGTEDLSEQTQHARLYSDLLQACADVSLVEFMYPEFIACQIKLELS